MRKVLFLIREVIREHKRSNWEMRFGIHWVMHEDDKKRYVEAIGENPYNKPKTGHADISADLPIQQKPVPNPLQSASEPNFSPEMTQAMAEYPQWTQDELQGYSDQDELQGYFDQGWSVLKLYGWVLNKKRQEEDRINREEKRKEQDRINREEKRKEKKKFKCSYCNSGTNEVCDVPNGCKNGICKKCRESGRAKEHYRYVVTKKGWISNQVYPVHNGYKCHECSKSKWRDDGSDVGY